MRWVERGSQMAVRWLVTISGKSFEMVPVPLTPWIGPFTGNTSTPILFIANKADNVTPYRSAVQNARGFKDSVVLVQDSYGVSLSI
jgi:hypothetical protein